MNEKAVELVEIFGKELALKVVDQLLNRDKQWIEKLQKEVPEQWEVSDFTKSVKLSDDLKAAIQQL